MASTKLKLYLVPRSGHLTRGLFPSNPQLTFLRCLYTSTLVKFAKLSRFFSKSNRVWQSLKAIQLFWIWHWTMSKKMPKKVQINRLVDAMLVRNKLVLFQVLILHTYWIRHHHFWAILKIWRKYLTDYWEIFIMEYW